MIHGLTSNAPEQAARHRAARRALVGWKLYRVGGRRRRTTLQQQLVDEAQRCAELGIETVEQAARAERFHNYGVTR